ncbi:hypothetical protein EJB05_07189, partial [Eragrostis curvula]
MPSSTILAAAEAAPSRRRRRRRNDQQSLESVTLPLSVFRSLQLPPRDWAGLPPDIISSIFHRLDHVEIMLCADKVCRSWRRAAREEPELWRRIDMRGHDELTHRGLADLTKMAADALLRSQGQCEAFSGEGRGVDDNFLRSLADQAPLLKSLILIACREISNKGFMEAIKRFRLLEELEISECWVHTREALKDFAKNALGDTYSPTIVRKKAKNYRRKTKRLLTELLKNNVYSKESDREEVQPDGSDIAKCSTCLMIEYLSWNVFDSDEHCDYEYNDPSYGLDSIDDTCFDVYDKMLRKRLRRRITWNNNQ